MAVRILVVDSDPIVQRALGNALAQAGFEVRVAPDQAEALRLAKADKPELALVASSLSGGDGIVVVSKLRAEEAPGVHLPIVVLLADQNAETRAAALKAGADDYLTKPFHPAELMARMRSLLSRYQPSEPLVGRGPTVMRTKEPARVLLFYGAKGGVGTTTLAINTAIALRKDLDKRVCLIDANLQFGDHRVFLDLPLDRMSVVDVATAPSRDTELVRSILTKHESGIELLLAPPSPEMAELVTSDHLPEVVTLLSHDFDYIVIDVDKRLDEINLRLMDVATAIYVVMMADLPCLKNVRLVLETIGHLGYSADKVKLVLNRSNAFTGINVRNAESALKRRIDYQLPNDYRAAVSALNNGTPVLSARADGVLSRALVEFVRSVDKEIDGIKAAKPAP
jgi:pilus assembly protein CpaE